MKLSESDKVILLLSAREAIQSLFLDVVSPAIDYTNYPELKKSMGAFVTLHKKNKLRGCIGYLHPDMTLFQTVCEAAKQAAFNDPRFPPLSFNEVSEIFVEISILSPMEPISSYDQIKVGEHGLVLEAGRHRALLLPQVAVEHNLTREQFLSSLCEKAGLPINLWKDGILNIKTFTAEVFSETEERKATYEHI